MGIELDSTSVRAPPRGPADVLDDFSKVGDEMTGRRKLSRMGHIPLAPTMIPGFPHFEQPYLDAQSLLEKIIPGTVSLGEGPRWHFCYIDSAVQSFLQESRC